MFPNLRVLALTLSATRDATSHWLRPAEAAGRGSSRASAHPPAVAGPVERVAAGGAAYGAEQTGARANGHVHPVSALGCSDPACNGSVSGSGLLDAKTNAQVLTGAGPGAGTAGGGPGEGLSHQEDVTADSLVCDAALRALLASGADGGLSQLHRLQVLDLSQTSASLSPVTWASLVGALPAGTKVRWAWGGERCSSGSRQLYHSAVKQARREGPVCMLILDKWAAAKHMLMLLLKCRWLRL